MTETKSFWVTFMKTLTATFNVHAESEQEAREKLEKMAKTDNIEEHVEDAWEIGEISFDLWED